MPLYKDKSNAERLSIAMDIHRNRCCRGLARLRHPIAVAVGRTFLEEGFITDEDLQETLSRCPGTPLGQLALQATMDKS
ncbi:hypothetical protein G6F45_013703 [Rhizopus arrhizus]|uniref:Uncharacterized protein n=2 Tax=Rhizopus TaxID=4842 RepID=A0A9P6Y2G5_9FUNG|nr:hypothetical protein G6F51_013750 [Rhizopus arrhizus]KAG1537627.1 hypothetical protein G6F50_014829 [Rhizopus delemar]KAG1607792.1 hypothetical protein G6F45_013703 [Rhizopus arrhizus]